MEKPQESFLDRVFGGAAFILSWLMLSASTIGPGSVIVCSKSGAEHGAKLVWSIFAACFVAFTLQEGAARLSIVSGKTLGQAMMSRYGKGDMVVTPKMSYAAALGVVIGNCAYGANCLAGALAALYIVHDNTTNFRVGACTFFIGAAMILLFSGKTEALSVWLGLIVILMASTFAIAANSVDVSGPALLGGLLPQLPSGSATTVLSIVGTTAIPFTMFLAGTLAEGYDVESMRLGVGFSVYMAGLISILLVIVGTSVSLAGDEFSVEDLAVTLSVHVGEYAMLLFVFGLFSSAFSALLSCTLGAAISVQSLLTLPPSAHSNAPNVPVPPRARRETMISVTADDNLVHRSAPVGAPHRAESAQTMDKTSENVQTTSSQTGEGESDAVGGISGMWHSQGLRFRGIMLLVLAVTSVMNLFNVNAIFIVVTAQLVNGLLLPFLAYCLLMCLNDQRLMSRRPQSKWENVAMLVSVGTTVYLAFVVVISNFHELGLLPLPVPHVQANPDQLKGLTNTSSASAKAEAQLALRKDQAAAEAAAVDAMELKLAALFSALAMALIGYQVFREHSKSTKVQAQADTSAENQGHQAAATPKASNLQHNEAESAPLVGKVPRET